MAPRRDSLFWIRIPRPCTCGSTMNGNDITSLVQRLDRIEALLAALTERQSVRDWYSTEEVAKILGKAEFTVREWCRLGRVRAEKKGSGRGRYQSWTISHAEIQRIQREGLLRRDGPHRPCF